MRGHRHRLLTLGVLVGTSALLGAGFPTKTVSPEKWVKSVCTALGTWADDLAAAQEDVDQDETDLERRQGDLAEYLDEVTDATNTLVKRLKKAGRPGVDNGKGVTRAFRRGFSQARDTFADAADDAEALETEDRSQFDEDVLEIQDAIRAGAADISATFDDAEEKYDVPELDEAFDDEAACSGIT